MYRAVFVINWLLLQFAIFGTCRNAKLFRIGVGSFPDQKHSGKQSFQRFLNLIFFFYIFLAVKNAQKFTDDQTIIESKCIGNCQQKFLEPSIINEPVKSPVIFDKNFNFGTNDQFAIPIVGQWLTGSDTVDAQTNTNVNVGLTPNFSFNKAFEALNLFKSNDIVKQVGVRGNGNYGAGFDSQSSLLYNLIKSLNILDANFNLRNGFDLKRQKGIEGFYTESDSTNVNPLGLSFDTAKKVCIAEFFIRGLCFESRQGFSKKK